MKSRKSFDGKCGPKCLGGFDYVSDINGTTWARCTTCELHHRLSPGGYVDWALGMLIRTPGTAGSMWTQKPSSEFLYDPSDVTG